MICSVLCAKLRGVGSESRFSDTYPRVNVLGVFPIILVTLLGFLVRGLPVSTGKGRGE